MEIRHLLRGSVRRLPACLVVAGAGGSHRADREPSPSPDCVIHSQRRIERMDYRALLAAPLAALAMTASSADALRQPDGWFAGATYAYPAGPTHEAGVGEGFMPLYLQPGMVDDLIAAPLGAPACPQWCEVSVVADIPAGREGFAQVGLALVGNGQVWARGMRLELVGPDVPLTQHRFAAEQGAAARAEQQAWLQARAAKRTPPQSVTLD